MGRNLNGESDRIPHPPNSDRIPSTPQTAIALPTTSPNSDRTSSTSHHLFLNEPQRRRERRGRREERAIAL
ncbi:hypothetical protein [Trichormus sp. NMC-1]|uniref:hypothetical protein n=1 Tax=Trichormus sp. NMC-1 TaxID=1853259 RepID=UPI00115FFA5B|nr:hypothetical protein [Trichormus sp. NMC-1]